MSPRSLWPGKIVVYAASCGTTLTDGNLTVRVRLPGSSHEQSVSWERMAADAQLFWLRRRYPTTSSWCTSSTAPPDIAAAVNEMRQRAGVRRPACAGP